MRVFQGKLAVVTGGSRGIGLATAKVLDDAGARAVLVVRDLERLKTAARSLAGGEVVLVPCDLSDREQTERAIGEIRENFGTPDILINNAGIFRVAPVHETTTHEFELALRVNLLAPFVFIRAFVADMKARGAGHIVTIGSIADRMIFADNSAYAASKFGARAMHEVLRAELKGSGVRATLVSPGPVDTAIWDELDPDNRPGFTPRAEMLSPAAVAAAVEFALTRPKEVNVDELRLSRS